MQVTALDYEIDEDEQDLDKDGRQDRVLVCDKGVNESGGSSHFVLICHELCPTLFCQHFNQESQPLLVTCWNWYLECLLKTKL